MRIKLKVKTILAQYNNSNLVIINCNLFFPHLHNCRPVNVSDLQWTNKFYLFIYKSGNILMQVTLF